MNPHASTLPQIVVEFFNRAADDAELSERMSFANTTVHIHVTDLDGDDACTVYLDRDPIGAELGAVGTAEVELFGPTKAYVNLFLGKDQLPISILSGAVTYTGPVRKFLRVVPILQSFDFGVLRGLDSAPVSPVGSIGPSGPAA